MLPQWYSDLNSRERATGARAASSPVPLVTPVIFTPVRKTVTQNTGEDGLKIKRAWELALAPAKSLPVQLIMGYFTGTSLQMVTILMTFYMYFAGPLKQIYSVNQIFSQVESPRVKDDILLTKIVFVACQLLYVAMGIWKVQQMGLLPTHARDWVGLERPRTYLEHL